MCMFTSTPPTRRIYYILHPPVHHSKEHNKKEQSSQAIDLCFFNISFSVGLTPTTNISSHIKLSNTLILHNLWVLFLVVGITNLVNTALSQ